MTEIETLLVPLCLAGVTLPLVIRTWRGGRRRVAGAAAALWLAGSLAMGWTSVDYAPARAAATPVTDRPIEVPADGYVRSGTCRACHPREYETWRGSFHRTMTQVASPSTMLAPWPEEAPRAFRFEERDYRIQQRGDEYWIEMDDPDFEGEYGVPPRVWRRVVQITGAHHWQFFWFATGKSRRVHLFPFAYRVTDTPRWMPLDGCCVSPPSDRQLSGVARWSISCNKCHATHGRPRVHGPDEIDTHVAELGIACEACHGPGGEHSAQNRDPLRRYAMHLAQAGDPTIVDPADLDHVRASMVCGNCHSVTRFKSDEDRLAWGEHGFRFRPGDLITDSRDIDVAGADKFWSDGMIRVSGREFNGLARSPCYVRGEMSCLSCHELHPQADDPRPLAEWADDQLKRGMRGNPACTQCHPEYLDEAALVAHTHHPADSAGSNCYDCHMPYTTYGLLKGIRTHEVHSPSVAASLETGRPNGCSQCHLDRPLAWAAEHLEEWYGIPAPPTEGDEREVAAGVLWATRGDAGQRALAAWSMGWDDAREASGTDWMTPFLALMLQDPYHAVRYIAQRSLGLQRGYEDLLAQYDFALPRHERPASSNRIYTAWRARANPDRRRERALLVDPDGQLMEQELFRLIQEQDTSPVTLNE